MYCLGSNLQYHANHGLGREQRLALSKLVKLVIGWTSDRLNIYLDKQQCLLTAVNNHLKLQKKHFSKPHYSTRRKFRGINLDFAVELDPWPWLHPRDRIAGHQVEKEQFLSA